MTRVLFCILFVLLANAGAFAQRTWKVSCNGGPGVDFTDLPQAVAAAAPGDSVWVFYFPGQPCPGGGYLYTAPVVNKPIRIQGFVVSGSGAGSIPQAQVAIVGAIEVRDIAAGEQVVISGLASYALGYSTPFLANGLIVANCAGDVLLENIRVHSQGWYGCTARIDSSSHVVLRGSEVRTGDTAFEIVNSDVVLTTTSVSQDYPLPQFPIYPNWTSYTATVPGLWIDHSTVTLIDSVVDGGWLPPFGPPGTPGVFLNTSTLRIGPSTVLRGSYIGFGSYRPAYQAANQSLCMVERDPRTTIHSEFGLQPPAIPTTISSVYHGWVVAGQPYGLTVAGPGGYALLVFGDLAPTATPTIWGPFAPTLASAYPVELVATDAQGFYDWVFTCPSTAPIATPFVFQALTLSPTGVFGFTEPSPVVVGWPFGVVP